MHKSMAHAYFAMSVKIKYMEDNVKTFSKSDLKTGMKVVTRAGSSYLVLRDHAIRDISTDVFVEINRRGWWRYDDSLKEDLTHCHKDLDIVEVYQPNTPYDFVFKIHSEDQWKLLWKREEMSPEQKEMKAIEDEMAKLQERAKKLREQV